MGLEEGLRGLDLRLAVVGRRAGAEGDAGAADVVEQRGRRGAAAGEVGQLQRVLLRAGLVDHLVGEAVGRRPLSGLVARGVGVAERDVVAGPGGGRAERRCPVVGVTVVGAAAGRRSVRARRRGRRVVRRRRPSCRCSNTRRVRRRGPAPPRPRGRRARRRRAIRIAPRGQRTRSRQGRGATGHGRPCYARATAGPSGGLAASSGRGAAAASAVGGAAARVTVRPGWRDDQATVHGHLRPGPVPPRRPAAPDRDRPVPGRRARPRRVLAAAVRAAADGRPGPRRRPARVGGLEHRVPAGRPAGRWLAGDAGGRRGGGGRAGRPRRSGRPRRAPRPRAGRRRRALGRRPPGPLAGRPPGPAGRRARRRPAR